LGGDGTNVSIPLRRVPFRSGHRRAWIARVIPVESWRSVSSWSMSAVSTSWPVTRASPRRSAVSRCQMSRARCWAGVRSTVRRVRRPLGLPIAARRSVGAVSSRGAAGAACMRDRSASALKRSAVNVGPLLNVKHQQVRNQYVRRSVIPQTAVVSGGGVGDRVVFVRCRRGIKQRSLAPSTMVTAPGCGHR
jgi:hypothetical protein